MIEEKEVSRNSFLTLNVYLLCMLLIDYLEELKYIPAWVRRIKNYGNLFKRELELGPIESEINRIYEKSESDFEYMVKRYNKLTKLISTYNPEELEDYISIAEAFKERPEDFRKHFKMESNEKSERKTSKDIV